MPTLPLRSGTLHYEDAGAGAPVVLVHGWSLSSAMFGDLLPGLARSRRVIAPDLRGHGRSGAGGPFGLADLAADLAALAERLSLERAVVVGWSLGAQVALRALPLLRDRIARLVLVSATPRFTAGEGWPHGLPVRSVEALAHRLRRDPAPALARFFEGMFAEGELDPPGRARVARVRAAIRTPDPAPAAPGLDLLLREDLRPALPSVDVPTLLVHGERDPICPPGASRAASEAIPAARWIGIAGAGHAPFLSRPGAFGDALAPFLEGEA